MRAVLLCAVSGIVCGAACAAEPQVSVLREGREGLVRCAFSETEDMVVQVRNLVNEWAWIVPRDCPTKDFAKGELVHAGPDDFVATHLGDFGFMSGNHGSYFVHVQTVKGHGFTAADVGKAVTHESGEPFVIVGVPDKDHVLLHPEGKPGANPCFPYIAKGRFTCGGKSWEPTETSRNQLWPMSRYRGFRWQTDDGREAPEGREVSSSRVDLVLEHDVLDPRGVLAYLKAHPGADGYAFGIDKTYALVETPAAAAAAGDFMKIPALMTVKTTYRYDGRCCRQALHETTYRAPIRSVMVLDVCYCWNQGEGKWEDVRFYIPRLKPVTLKGKGGAPDVRCDFTATEKMPYPPWCVNTHLSRNDATDPANPPDRFIRRLSRGDRRLGVAVGYSLTDGVSALGNGWPNRETLYHFWDTGKMYPYVMDLHDVKPGAVYRHNSYTQFFDPRREPDATAFYCHREGDALVVYMDFHKTLKGKRVALPAEAAGLGFKVLEKTPSVTVHGDRVAADGSVVLDVADGYGTLVLRVDLDQREWAALRVDVRSSRDGTLQPCYFWAPERAKSAPVPLVVGLHTWSGDIGRYSNYKPVLAEARRRGWAFVGPNFRGSNDTPAGCGSDLAVQDIVDAVGYAKSRVRIDSRRVYIIGGSGGGHMTLLMLGRHPEVFAAGAAFCPITDLARWHADSRLKHPGRDPAYADMMEAACGGTPAERPEAYAARSPLTWLEAARDAGVPAYVATGIHDGWIGSVPVGHAIRAYNALCRPGDGIGEDVIARVEAQRDLPDGFDCGDLRDPFYSERKRVRLRRTSGNVRLTLFDSGHDICYPAGFDFLARQTKGRPVDWTVPAAADDGPTEGLTR